MYGLFAYLLDSRLNVGKSSRYSWLNFGVKMLVNICNYFIHGAHGIDATAKPFVKKPTALRTSGVGCWIHLESTLCLK